jgi:hypothetical protein
MNLADFIFKKNFTKKNLNKKVKKKVSRIELV